MISQNKTTSFKKSAVASAITTALLFSVGGHAEESEDQSAEKNNVITVTANRREQSVQKVPFNISAISGDFLDDAQITDAGELMRSIAGVAVVDRGHRNSGVINGIMIRGLNVDGSALGDFALSAVPTVSTYVNDTPVYANFILKDIDRVEILRGPQSTLYGSGSLGGTVKYLINRPELDEFSGKVTAGMSSTSGSSSLSWNTDVILNIPLSDSVAIRFVGGKVDYAGVTDYVNVYELDENRIPIAPDGVFSTTESTRSVKDADTVDIEHARISLLVEPNDQFSALFSYQTQSDDIGGRRQQTVGNNGFGESYGDNEIGSAVLEPSSRDVDLGSLEMDLDLGFATLTSSTSKYNHRGDSISENTGFYAQNNWLANFYYNYPRPLAEAQRTFSDKAFVQELRIVSNGDSNIDYVAGIFYQDQDLVSTQDSYLRGFTIWADAAFGFSATTGDKDFEYRRDQNFKDKAVFGELTYHFTDDYRMTFGGRFFSNKSVNDTSMTVGLYRAFSPTDSAHFVEKDKGSLFKVNFAYDLAENQMLYGTVSEGYRRGGTNAVPLVGTFAESPTWQTFDPDTVTNYELGIKGRSGNMNYSLSAFYVDWQDIQINTATTLWGFFAAQNGGDASTKGVELEIDGYLDENEEWHYGFGYTYVDASLDEDVFTPDDATQSFPVALKGTTLPGAARNTVSASLTNTQNLSKGLYWVNRLGYYHQSGTENAISNSDRFKQHFDGFSIIDFSSSISKNEWTATLWVKNLTNEEGTTGAFKEQYMGTSPAQNYNGNGSKEFLALPRTIGLTLSYEF